MQLTFAFSYLPLVDIEPLGMNINLLKCCLWHWIMCTPILKVVIMIYVSCVRRSEFKDCGQLDKWVFMKLSASNHFFNVLSTLDFFCHFPFPFSLCPLFLSIGYWILLAALPLSNYLFGLHPWQMGLLLGELVEITSRPGVLPSPCGGGLPFLHPPWACASSVGCFHSHVNALFASITSVGCDVSMLRRLHHDTRVQGWFGCPYIVV